MPSVFITGKISNISLDFSVYESISLSYSLVLGSSMWFVKHGSLSGESCAITGFQVLYYLHTHINTQPYTYIHIQPYTHIHTHTHIHTYIHTYIHTHTTIHTHTYIYTHI